MKLAYEQRGADALRATLSGDLEVASCTCLENFWELRLADAQDLELDVSGIEGVDPDGLELLVKLVGSQLEAGGRVVVQGADARLQAGLGSLTTREGLSLSDDQAHDRPGGD
jgi:ABC-type transporter Mla MlaB component